MRGYITLLIAFTATVFVSCSGKGTRFNDSSINTDAKLISIERFDRDIFSLSQSELKDKYDGFLPIYLQGVLNLRSEDQLSLFTSDSGIVLLSKDVEKVYNDHSKIEKELNTAFNYYSYYFPNKEVPRVLFHISGFNQAIVTTDGFLSASIDQYLGSDYQMYSGIAYGYELPFMTPYQLPIDMMKGWLMASFPESLSGDRLLDDMLYQGKLIYLLKVFFPDSPECRLLAYTEKQYEWCERYEKEVWGYIMENRELFSTDWKVHTKYISPAPFTTGLSQESPGRIGVYIGYKIVKSFIDSNPDATLQGLMEFADSQLFLQKAVYKP